MKKLSQQILLGGAIFLVLAIAPFFTSTVSASGEADPYSQVVEKTKRLLTLLHERTTETAPDLGYCAECEVKLIQDFRAVAEDATKYLGVYKIVSETVISGETLSALKKQARESSEETPTARRRSNDKPLADLVMAFPENHTPILKLDTLEEFEYARAVILAPLQSLFPSEDFIDLIPAINGWICNLNSYDLSAAYERKRRAKNKLVELWANSEDSLTTKRERDLAALVMECIEEADDLWKVLRKSLQPPSK